MNLLIYIEKIEMMLHTNDRYKTKTCPIYTADSIDQSSIYNRSAVRTSESCMNMNIHVRTPSSFPKVVTRRIRTWHKIRLNPSSVSPTRRGEIIIYASSCCLARSYIFDQYSILHIWPAGQFQGFFKLVSLEVLLAAGCL